MIDFLQQHGMLAREMVCVCGQAMRMQNFGRSSDGKIFRCNNCKKTKSIRWGSFFDHSKLPLWKIFALTYCFCQEAGRAKGVTQEFLMRELEIASEHTIVDWRQFCRDVCVAYFENNPQQIGGPGVVVEIDESVFARRKYNVGHHVPQQWMFGGYEPARGIGFIVPVDRRDAQTLIPLIQQWIQPGSTIVSDEWAAYRNLANQAQYVHLTVNHRYNFVNPNNGATTNHVERMWGAAKAKIKSNNGIPRDMISDYMSEFMFFQRHRDCMFYHFWTIIARDLYPV